MNYNYISSDERAHPHNQSLYQHSLQERNTLNQNMYNDVQNFSSGKRVRFTMDGCEQPALGVAPSSSRMLSSGPPRPQFTPQFLHEGPPVPCQPQYGMVPVSPHTPLAPHSHQRYEYFGFPSPYISNVPEVPTFHNPVLGDYPQQPVYQHAMVKSTLPTQAQQAMAPVKRTLEMGKDTKTKPAVSISNTPTVKKPTPRYSFTTPNRGQTGTSQEVTTVTKTPQAPKMASMPLKVLSGSVDKIIKWTKLDDARNFLFEVTGTLVSLRTGLSLCQKILQLKEVTGQALQCVFYEIDRPLPYLQQGQQIRCVGKMIARNKLQVFCVRVMAIAERSYLQRLSFICQRRLPAPKPVGVALPPPPNESSDKVLGKH